MPERHTYYFDASLSKRCFDIHLKEFIFYLTHKAIMEFDLFHNIEVFEVNEEFLSVVQLLWSAL